MEDKVLQLEHKLEKDFVASIKKMNDTDVKNHMVKLLKAIQDDETKRDEDPIIADLQEKLKDLKGGYKDLIKPKTLRLAYLLEVIKERGSV